MVAEGAATPDDAVRVVVVDDQELFRRGLTMLLGVEPGIEVVGEAGDGPLVVREKSHPATPMTLEQALYEMELVGHDFYLFVDKESEKPSVVYRRRGYDYGVISLDVG